MSKNRFTLLASRFSRIALALALVFGLGPTADADEPTSQKKVTIHVECGGQGVVDKDWTIEFDLYKDGKKVNSEPISVSVPTGTGSGAAAQRMATAADLHAGEEAASSGETEHEDHTPPKTDENQGKLEAEDVTLEDGYEIKNVKTTNKGSGSSHLKVKQWEKEIEKEEDGRDARQLKRTGATLAAAAIGPATVLPAQPYPYPGPAIPNGRIQLIDADAREIAFAISISGTYASGAHFDETIEVPLDASVGLSALAGWIGAWANSIGFTTSYPTNETVVLQFSGSGITVDFWSFAAYPYLSDPGVEESVTVNAQ